MTKDFPLCDNFHRNVSSSSTHSDSHTHSQKPTDEGDSTLSFILPYMAALTFDIYSSYHRFCSSPCFVYPQPWHSGFPDGSAGKEFTCNAGYRRHELEDPLEEEMANHSSILAWEIP